MDRNPQGLYLCPICGKTFVFSAYAYQHWYLDHVESQMEEQNEDMG